MKCVRIIHECMRCQATITVDKERCRDAMSCPACRGPIRCTGTEEVKFFGDGEPVESEITQYEVLEKLGVLVYDSLGISRSLNDILQDVEKAVSHMWNPTNNPLINRNLLLIALKDVGAVPEVFYQGKEVDCKTNISFDWETDTEVSGGTMFAIEHIEQGKDERGKGFPIRKRIEKHIKGHA